MKTSKKCVYLLALLFLSTIPRTEGVVGPTFHGGCCLPSPCWGHSKGRQGKAPRSRRRGERVEEELMDATGQEDPLGLRDCQACSRIPAPTLHDYLAKRLWPLHVMHRAVFDLNYKWVQYSCCDAAEKLVWENFHDRAVEQEAAYKTHHQAASRAWWVVNLSIHPLSQTL